MTNFTIEINGTTYEINTEAAGAFDFLNDLSPEDRYEAMCQICDCIVGWSFIG